VEGGELVEVALWLGEQKQGDVVPGGCGLAAARDGDRNNPTPVIVGDEPAELHTRISVMTDNALPKSKKKTVLFAPVPDSLEPLERIVGERSKNPVTSLESSKAFLKGGTQLFNFGA
jgi:hypothetical protein